MRRNGKSGSVLLGTTVDREGKVIGVVVLDAPESYAAKIPAAIAQVTDEPIVMLVYTHAHKDHIGGSAAFAKIPGLKIVALHSVQEFLQEKQDPNRLVPTQTFADHKTLKIGDKKNRASPHPKLSLRRGRLDGVPT